VPGANSSKPRRISASVQHQILAEIPWERRGAFLAARLGVRPGEIRAADVTDYRIVEGAPGLTISRAMKGPNSNAPTWGTKGRNAAWIPVDEELQRWIEWRLVRVSKEEMLRERIPLFPNPTARNRGRRWIANTLRAEWNRAAEKIGVRVRMYEGTKHSSATAWLAQGSSLQMIQRMLRHADSRSTERYAKLGDLALVSVIRPRRKRVVDPHVDPMWIQGQSGFANPSIYNDFWRGGRDSNPRRPATSFRNREGFSRRPRAQGVLKAPGGTGEPEPSGKRAYGLVSSLYALLSSLNAGGAFRQPHR
jgi:hypothetical protein